MQDLLYGFEYPSIMDIKIGVRTFLENDNESDEKETKPRRDLYDRLVEMAPDEPTAEEHQLKAVTKRRYMSWRERSTCSATLGFRIEAIKVTLIYINSLSLYITKNLYFRKIKYKKRSFIAFEQRRKFNIISRTTLITRST